MDRNKKSEIFNLANAVTSMRIWGAIAVLFIEPLGTAFYVVYTLCGLSDGIDGTIARKTGTSSEFGAKLDSISDLIFYVVMFVKIFPVLWDRMPIWIWYIVGIVLIIRILSYSIAAIKFRRFAAIHTYMNKITGSLFFLLPYFLLVPCDVQLCVVLCAFGFAGSLEELIIHCRAKEYIPEKKSLFR